MAQSERYTPRHTPDGDPGRVVADTAEVHGTTYPVQILGVSRPVYVSGTSDERIAAIARLQRGRVNRDQLHSAHISDRMVHVRVTNGALHRKHRSVFTVGHSAPTPLGDETAALLACGEHAVLSHYSAALIHRLIPHGDGQIHVTIRGRHGANPVGVKVHRTGRLNRNEVEVVERLPVTSAARTILDLASTADIATVARAIEEALTQNLVSERGLRTLAARVTGQRSGRIVRAILDTDKEPGITKSKAERRFRALLRAAQLPPPKTNFPFHGYSLDCYWPDLGVVIEVQGYQFHSSRKKFERDTRKGAVLTAAGLSVSYVTWLQMDNEPFAVIARVAQTLTLARTRRQAA